MATLTASQLSLKDVHQLLGFQRQYNNSFISLLYLEKLTDVEKKELEQIRDDFDFYLTEDEVSEGQVKLLTISPLLRLGGFYRHPIRITLEEKIGDIDIEDSDTKIRGRLDILAVHRTRQTATNASFWILVIESKNSEIAPAAGLSQLLTYAFPSLKFQESVWGLTTNGMGYQFVYIQSDKPPIYQLMPFLNLMEPEPSVKILQVFKAIWKQIIHNLYPCHFLNHHRVIFL